MRKPYETSADRLWKEKLESCVSLQEALVLLLFVVAMLVAGALVVMGG